MSGKPPAHIRMTEQDGSVTKVWYKYLSGIGAGAPTDVTGGIGFLNGWSDLGAPEQLASYWTDGNMVWLRGVITGGTLGLPAFTLPTGFRPLAIELWPTVSNGAFGICSIAATGDVVPFGSNVYFSLSGIAFRTDQ